MAELLTFALGDLFGILTLLVGIGVGFWLGKTLRSGGKATPDGPYPPSHIYREQLSGMLQFTHHITGDLTRHLETLEDLKQTLSSADSDPEKHEKAAASKTTQLIAEMTATNQRLKQRLESAEATLKIQAQELEESLSAARTDSLTGLLNRRAFDEECGKRWSLWERKRSPFCVLLLDIDHFKAVNDRYGHAAGDLVLQEVARRLRSVMRNSDYVARIGGEELAILLPETEWDAVISVATKVLHIVRSAPISCDDFSISVTVSCGIMSVIHAQRSEDLYTGADSALYAAKAAGRDRGFVNDGRSLIPIDRFAPPRRDKPVDIALADAPPRSADGGQSLATQPESELTAAADALKARLLQITQGQ